MKPSLSLGAIGAAICLLSLHVPVQAAAAPVARSATAAATRHYELQTNIVDGKMVFVDDKGQVNPPLVANMGDTVELVLKSGEGAEHDLVIPELKVTSAKFSAGSGKVTLRFKVTRAGSFTYYCSIPGHRQIGMEGKLQVSGPALVAAGTAAAPAATPASESSQAALALYTPAPSPMRGPDPAAVSVAANPASVPAAIGARAPQLLKYRMETVELPGKLDDGTTVTYWTFNRQVPGPMLRARVGDTVELTLANAGDSKMIHSIDLHAVTGGHGGGQHTQVAPGQE